MPIVFARIEFQVLEIFEWPNVSIFVKTPTQPQHNLIQPEVGFDMIIAVHTTTTTHRELYFY